MRIIDNIFDNEISHEYVGEVYKLCINGIIYEKHTNSNIMAELSCIETPVASIIENIQRILKGKYIASLHTTSGDLFYFTDFFGRSDLFYTNCNNEIKLFKSIPVQDDIEIDDVGLTQVLITGVGPRPPKKHTVFKNISKLGYGEFLHINEKDAEINLSSRPPFSTEDFCDHSGVRFGEKFLKVIDDHASYEENFIYFSSGWDSTSILACLSKLRDKKTIRPVIARVTINQKDGPFNVFEIEKAKKFTDYYGVDLEIIDVDYGSLGAEILEKVRPFKAKFGYYGYSVNWHYLVAEHIAKIKKSESAVIFSGEISDGVQNLGFSQYVSSLHPDLNFREYADKMRCYLYGPSFRKATHENIAGADPIVNFFKPDFEAEFDKKIAKFDEDEKDLRLLQSFFSSTSRMPFSTLEGAKGLTSEGVIKHSKEIQNTYFKKYLPIENQNWYSILIELYSSFHWNGSSVNTLYTANEEFDNNLILPFYDEDLIQYFSEVPENYGRGLDFHQVKHFLKSFLKNEIDYPMDLQEGPHSYLYDVDGSFINPNEGYVYGSLFDFYKSLLDDKYLSLLNPDFFDVPVLATAISNYKNGIKLNSDDFQLLLGWLHFLSTHSDLKS